MAALDPRLCVVLDPERPEGDPAELARAAARGGCTLLEQASSGGHARQAVETARRLRAALGGTGVPLLVAGRVDVSFAAEADGVHLEQADLHPIEARALIGRGRLLTLTIEDPAQADELYRMPVDGCWIAPIFAGVDAAGEGLGLNGLSRIAFRARLASGGAPVGASGGIEAATAARVIGAGADGVRVGLHGLRPEEAFETVRSIRRAVDEALAARGGGRP